ncbi:MAG: hypothetical protein GX254_06440 [Clostridiales bacterium]|nr:hypothetical protein [Clostridiales bacterium]
MFPNLCSKEGEIAGWTAPVICVTLLIGVMTLLLLITVTGSLGGRISQRMPLPFFNTFRAIEAIESFDRFEAIVVAIWVVADFIIITFCQGFAGYHIDVAEPKFFSTPAVLKGYIGSMYLPRNRTELELINICRAAG